MSVENRKKEVFNIAKSIAKDEGLSQLTIRRLAEESNISIGSVYNLFETKDKLIMDLIEDYWAESINEIMEKSKYSQGNFIDKLNILYINFAAITKEFHKDWIKDLVGIHMANPDVLFMSSHYKNKIEDIIEILLLEDESISISLNNGMNTKDLAGFIFDNIMLLLQENKKDLGFLEIVLNLVLYGGK